MRARQSSGCHKPGPYPAAWNSGGLQRDDVGIDAGGESGRDHLRIRAVGFPLGFQVAAVADGPGQAVALDGGRPDGFRQPPGADAAPEIDLEQTVARGDVALGEKQVVSIAGVDVGYAPTVTQNFHGLVKAGEWYRFRGQKDGANQQSGGSGDPGAAEAICRLAWSPAWPNLSRTWRAQLWIRPWILRQTSRHSLPVSLRSTVLCSCGRNR